MSHQQGHRQYVFGYGSLLERWNGPPDRECSWADPMACELNNYRRIWNVAMDNSLTVPGYKHYVDPTSGERPSWFVSFLNIVPDPDATVNGVLFEVTPELLERLDTRERNYERIDVSASLSRAVDGTAWAYAGSDAAVRRFHRGLRASRAVISRDYYEGVLDDFDRAGPDALQGFIELTDPAPCPIVDLQRVDSAGRAEPTDRR